MAKKPRLRASETRLPPDLIRDHGQLSQLFGLTTVRRNIAGAKVFEYQTKPGGKVHRRRRHVRSGFSLTILTAASRTKPAQAPHSSRIKKLAPPEKHDWQTRSAQTKNVDARLPGYPGRWRDWMLQSCVSVLVRLKIAFPATRQRFGGRRTAGKVRTECLHRWWL